MAVSNPHFTDDATGETFVLDESGFARVAAKYNQVAAVMTLEQFKLLYQHLYAVDAEFASRLLPGIYWSFSRVDWDALNSEKSEAIDRFLENPELGEHRERRRR